MKKAIQAAVIGSMAVLSACAGPAANDGGTTMRGAGHTAVRGAEDLSRDAERGLGMGAHAVRNGTMAVEDAGRSMTGDGRGMDAAHPYGAAGYSMADTATEIPSIDRAKKTTTYSHAGTTHGLGVSTYSLIGSSGLHSGGFSSHLESRLHADGIQGVKVFVFDDHVILATAKRSMASSSYDPMQKKLLSGTAGFSGHGAERPGSIGTYGAKGADMDNLEQAQAKLKEYLGSQVDVDSIDSDQAVELIDKLRDLLEQNGSKDQGEAGGEGEAKTPAEAGDEGAAAENGANNGEDSSGDMADSAGKASETGDLLADLLKLVAQRQR